MYPRYSYRSSARRTRTTRLSAGAAGFEPAIPGPKPGALPLGYAPVQPQKIIPERLFAVRISVLPRHYQNARVKSTFGKLGLAQSKADHRRVLGVLAYLHD